MKDSLEELRKAFGKLSDLPIEQRIKIINEIMKEKFGMIGGTSWDTMSPNSA